MRRHSEFARKKQSRHLKNAASKSELMLALTRSSPGALMLVALAARGVALPDMARDGTLQLQGRRVRESAVEISIEQWLTVHSVSSAHTIQVFHLYRRVWDKQFDLRDDNLLFTLLAGTLHRDRDHIYVCRCAVAPISVQLSPGNEVPAWRPVCDGSAHACAS